MKVSKKILFVLIVILTALFVIAEIETNNASPVIEVPPSGDEDFPTNI